MKSWRNFTKRIGRGSSNQTGHNSLPGDQPPDDAQKREASTITEIFPDGVKDWIPNPAAIVDICFVHGLTGNWDTTWTASSKEKPWPQEFLVNEIESARIFTYGYDAYVVRRGQASRNTLSDHATNFLHDLTRHRRKDSANNRPLILVAHSLGGLICKQALLISRNNPDEHLRNVFDKTKGIVFLGTPHTGSWMADWSKIPASLLGILKSTNKSLLDVLHTDNELLEFLHRRFLGLLRELRESSTNDRKIEVTCFYEELGLPVVGQVVSKASATFDHYDPIGIHANHMAMTKFSQPTETGFLRVAEEISRWASECSYDLHALSLDDELQDEAINTALTTLKIPVSQRSRQSLRRVLAALNLDETVAIMLSVNVPKMSIEGRVTAEEARKKIRQEYFDAVLKSQRSLVFGELEQRETAVLSAIPGSCIWVYDTPQYVRWSIEKNTLLWIKGNPGSGKSVLMKCLVDQRKKIENTQEESKQQILLSFFFNARGSDAEKSQIGLYKTLMRQIINQRPDLMCELVTIYLNKQKGLRGGGEVQWQSEELAEIFHNMVGRRDGYEIEVLIDALDECRDGTIRDLVRRFERSVQASSDNGGILRIIWSSRYFPYITMNSALGQEIEVKDKSRHDVLLVTQHHLPAAQNPDLQKLQLLLLYKAKDITFWAVLVARRIAEAFDAGLDYDELNTLLDKTPDNLNDLFDRIISDAHQSPEQRQNFQTLAKWVLCANRPLSSAELALALKIRSSGEVASLRNFVTKPINLDQFKKKIRDVSCGLFEVIHTVDNGQPVDIVQPIHDSVREFLFSSKGIEILESPSKTTFVTSGHFEIAVTCLRALSAPDLRRHAQLSQLQKYVQDTDAEHTEHCLEAFEYLRRLPFLGYIQNHAFEHFALSAAMFDDQSSVSDDLAQSASLRREALHTYLRISYCGILDSIPSSYTINHQLKFVEQHLSAFATDQDSLSTWAEVSASLRLISSALERKAIHLTGYGPQPQSELHHFLVLFYNYPASRGSFLSVLIFSVQQERAGQLYLRMLEPVLQFRNSKGMTREQICQLRGIFLTDWIALQRQEELCVCSDCKLLKERALDKCPGWNKDHLYGLVYNQTLRNTDHETDNGSKCALRRNGW